MAAILVSAKVYVFIARLKRLSPVFPTVLLGTNTNETQPKQRLDKLFITKEEQKARNKNKIGLPPNKRYHLTPLARHKSEDRSRYCHLWLAIHKWLS